MRLLAIVSGEYGLRHVKNIRTHAPSDWRISTWRAPAAFPIVIDYPEDFLPDKLSQTDLILHFGEHRAIAELIPEMVKLTNAQAVIAAVDNEAWLPRGLARQLRGWLERMGIVCVTPKPLCSLTEADYGISRRERLTYDQPLIAAFARFFGQPELEIEIDPEARTIISAGVKRDAVCGCAGYVAGKLVGLSADEAEEKAGLLHHHYPCMASMGKDSDFGDTLMHVSGNILKDDVAEKIKSFRRIKYLEPGERSK